jgi:hypothetical protein
VNPLTGELYADGVIPASAIIRSPARSSRSCRSRRGPAREQLRFAAAAAGLQRQVRRESRSHHSTRRMNAFGAGAIARSTTSSRRRFPATPAARATPSCTCSTSSSPAVSPTRDADRLLEVRLGVSRTRRASRRPESAPRTCRR